MTTQDEGSTKSPFTRPGFVVATIAVVMVVVLGIVLGVTSLMDNDPEHESDAASAPPSTTSPPSTSPTPGDSASVCGLEGVEDSESLAAAPPTEWEHQGPTAYPASLQYGPGESTADGVRYCFQHSPAGALFAAANGLVQATDGTTALAWLEHFAADGPYRDEVVASAAPDSEADVRLRIAGFRLLDYTGDSARVDIAVESFAQGTDVAGSFVYELVWQSGDWKLSTETPEPFSFASLPDLAGYVAWGE